MNSMKLMLCNNKQTNKNKSSNPPRVRPYLARATAGQVQWFTWQWCTWPIAGPQTLFVRREHTDSFRGCNLFTSSMQQRHPRASFMNCPYHALTGVLTGAWLCHWQRGPQTRYPAFNSFRERENRFGLAVRRKGGGCFCVCVCVCVCVVLFVVVVVFI